MIFFELFMFKNAFIAVISDFVEVIHVELPDKGAEISVSEMHRKNLLLEFFHIDNDEAVSLFTPADDFFILMVLRIRKCFTCRIW